MERPRWMDDGDLDDLRELARTFCARELAPHLDRWREQHHVDRSLWNRAGDAGLLCLSVPEKYGGGGGTFAHEAVLLEEVSRIGDTAWGIGVHSVVVAHYLLAYGTEEQKQTWLPRLASGESVGAVAMSEPGAGSDLKAIQTRAVRDGDEYRVTGAKTFITNGGQADVVVVVAKTEPAAGARGISLLLVETDQPGFSRGRVLDKIGQRGQDTTELFFDDVRVPEANVIGGEPGRGFAQLMQQLPQERLVIALTAVCGMESALAQTVRYTKERTAFGGTLLDLQNTRFSLAEVATETKIARVFVDDCIVKHLSGELDAATAAMAKWWATDRAMTAIDTCLQLHGGYGYMREYPIAHLWADHRVQRIYGGANEVMKEIIARTL